MRIRRLHCPAFALALLAASLFANGAQAFTIEELGSAPNSDGAARFSDRDSRFSGTGNSNRTTIKQGNTTLQFGGRPSFDQRYDNSRMFNPLGRPGEDR